MCARILALLAPISRAVANLRGETRPSSLASSSPPQPDSPGLAEQAFENGNAEDIKGNLDQAILGFSRAIELDPKFAGAYNNRGIAYADKGDLEQAIADFTQVIELDPDDADAYHNRAHAYEQKGLNSKAVADFETYLKLNPDASDRAEVVQSIRQLK